MKTSVNASSVSTVQPKKRVFYPAPMKSVVAHVNAMDKRIAYLKQTIGVDQ